MSLQCRVVASILRSSCPADRAPIRIPDAARQIDYLHELARQLRKGGTSAAIYNKNAPILDFSVNIDADLPHFEDGFDDLDHVYESVRVLFVGDTLQMEYPYRDETRVVVADVDQIQRVADTLHARLTTLAHRRQKTAKVRELKHRFVVARIHELAKRYKFWFEVQRLRTMASIEVDTIYDIVLFAEVPYTDVMPCMEKIEVLLIDLHENKKRRAKDRHVISWDTSRDRRWWTEDQSTTTWNKIPFATSP